MQIDQHISYKGIVFLVLLGVAFAAIGVMTKLKNDQLKNEGQVTEATVTGSRIMEKKSRRTYELQFSLKTTPDGPEFIPEDFMGRKNLWFTLPQAAWDEAVATKKVQVRYAASNPTNSRPVASDMGGDWGLVGMGAGSILIALIGLIRKKRAANRTA